jgi:pimeloyl-ACP methyl ester carboxylesterase
VPRHGSLELSDGRSVAWCEWGDPLGSPVVLLHGTPGSRLFSPDPRERSDEGVRLITFDRPGYGAAGSVAVASLSVVAETIASIADDLGHEEVGVVGFSGGGPYAFACGALIPERVSRIAVVSSWGPLDEVEAAYDSLSAAERDLVATLRADPAAATKLLWEHGQWFAETPLRMLDTEHEVADEPILADPAIRSNLEAANLEGARQQQAGLVADWVADARPWGFGFRLAEIRVPVDLWVGARDPGRAPLDAREIQRHIPECDLHTEAEAGHWLVVSHWPDILRRLVR